VVGCALGPEPERYPARVERLARPVEEELVDRGAELGFGGLGLISSKRSAQWTRCEVLTE
jgi:hypothetical protein